MSDLAKQLRDHPRFLGAPPVRRGTPDPGPMIPDLDDPGTWVVLLGWLVASGRFKELIAFSPGALGAPRTWAVYYRDSNERTASAVEPSIGEALARAVLAVWGPA